MFPKQLNINHFTWAIYCIGVLLVMCNPVLLIEAIRFLCQKLHTFLTFTSHMGKVREDLSYVSHPALALFSVACIDFCLKAYCTCFVCVYLSGHAEPRSKREKHHSFTANAHFSFEQLERLRTNRSVNNQTSIEDLMCNILIVRSCYANNTLKHVVAQH